MAYREWGGCWRNPGGVPSAGLRRDKIWGLNRGAEVKGRTVGRSVWGAARTNHRSELLAPPSAKQQPGQSRPGCCLVEGGGFEPPKSSTTDLQSAPFGHSGTLPYVLRRRAGRGRMCVPFYTRDGVDGAGERNRTINLLITNQLLCLLSYTSRECFVPRHLSRGTVRRADGEGGCLVPRGGLEPPTQGFSVPCSTN